MSRSVKIATVQPPAPNENSSADDVQNRAMELLEEAATANCDIVCLPEYLNCLACDLDQLFQRATTAASDALQKAQTIANQCNCYVILPLLMDVDGVLRNRANIINRNGEIVAYFDKVHITDVERNEWNITAGDSWDIYECDFGRIGIMICYDGCFIEPSRIYSLKGAEMLFWPSLQRSYTQTELELQTRAHAYFNYLTVIRSSYGTEPSQPWSPDTMVGMSCVCGPDGTMLANLGRWAGWTSTTIDLDKPQRGAKTFGGDCGLLKKMRFEDRRPETYKQIIKPN
jgi:predicted amidohydrolase